MKHELKILSPHFQAVFDGRKAFEIRKDDRGFQAGDTLLLKEYSPDVSPAIAYTGREIEVDVTYVTGHEQKPGYVVMAIFRRRMGCDRLRRLKQRVVAVFNLSPEVEEESFRDIIQNIQETCDEKRFKSMWAGLVNAVVGVIDGYEKQ